MFIKMNLMLILIWILSSMMVVAVSLNALVQLKVLHLGTCHPFVYFLKQFMTRVNQMA